MRLLFGSGFAAAWRDHVGLAAFAMAFNMTLPMVLWMRYRGHSWERGGEMAVAMYLPVLPLLLLYWLGADPGRAVLGLQMMLMVPAMLGRCSTARRSTARHIQGTDTIRAVVRGSAERRDTRRARGRPGEAVWTADFPLPAQRRPPAAAGFTSSL